ncbi:MAG: gamma-glutamyltransferase [Armatimonadetes bacterium]|nr:gamma-glutamyltransferase [Armatimonadota bacterium]
MSESISSRHWTHRGLVCAPRGVIATAHPLASAAGLRVLRDGGNALDACIAAAAVLNVVEPYNSHLGGDVFIQFYSAKDRKVTALNGSGNAPLAADPAAFAGSVPTRDSRAVTTPGQVHGWVTALERFGTWPLHRLLEDAIHYASEGFPVNPRLSDRIKAHENEFRDRPAWGEVFLPGGSPPAIGQTLKQPALARTLRLLADGGISAFYEGEIARKIADYCREHSGWIREEDLKEHRSELLDPIRTTYRDLTVTEQPPVSQGLILLEMLNLVERFDLPGMGPRSAQAVHLMVEAKKLAFADRLAAMGDPRHVDAPTERLISKEYAALRVQDLDPDRAASNPPPGDWHSPQDTTYLCAADSEGNAVSFIQSLFHSFGSGHMVPELGIMLNNRLTGFSLQPGHPNALAPRKRPIHTLNTYMILDGDRLWGVGGTPGGDVQVQTNLQMITQLVDEGLNPQEAIEMPKWSSEPSGTLNVESRFPDDVLRELEAKGHRLNVGGAWSGACAVQFIRVHPETGAYLAGSDPRADGQAAGF